MIAVANEIADAGYDPQGRSSEELLDLAESRVFQIAENRASKDEGPKSIDRILEDTVSRIEQLYQRPHDGVTGVSSGYQDLDKKNRRVAEIRPDYRGGTSFHGENHLRHEPV
ncbi:hypothetical protein DZS_46710 [Dickeya ananatis]